MRGQGTVERLSSGRWRLRLPRSLSKGKRSGATYDSEGEARGVLAELRKIAELSIGAAAQDTLAGWGEVVMQRRAEQGLATAKDDAGRWAHVLDSDLTQMALKAIEVQHVRDFARWLSRRPARRGGRLSRQTQQHVLNLLRVVLEEARLDGKLAGGVNPAAAVRPAPVAEGEQLDKWAWLTAAEIDRLLTCAALPQEARDLYTVAIYTGLRQGELWALTWADVTLDGPRPQIVVSRSGKSRTTKSGKVRAVPLLPAALDALRRMAERAGANGRDSVRGGLEEQADGVYGARLFAAEENGAMVGRPPKQDMPRRRTLDRARPLFPSATGGHRNTNDDGGWADKRRGQQRVQPGHRTIAGLREGVRFHDLRHTCASHLVQGTWGRRWRLDEVRDFLGHSSITVTQRYAHLGAEALHEAAAATRREDEQCQIQSHSQPVPVIAETRPTAWRAGAAPVNSTESASAASALAMTTNTTTARAISSGMTCDSPGPRSGPRPALSLVPSPTARPAGIEPAAHGLEGRGSPEDLRGLTPFLGPPVGRIAEEIIAHAAGGLELPTDLADQLARAVLDDPLVQLAQQVLEGGDLLYAYAVRLAGKVLERRRIDSKGTYKPAEVG